MAVIREEKSGNGRITLCEPQDERRQPHYNLTSDVPSNYSEFEGNGARNAHAYRKHTHTQTLSALYIRLCATLCLFPFLFLLYIYSAYTLLF